MSNFQLQVMLSRVAPTFLSIFWDPQYADSPIVAAETVLVAEGDWHGFSHGIKYCNMIIYVQRMLWLPKPGGQKNGMVNHDQAGGYRGNHFELPCCNFIVEPAVDPSLVVWTKLLGETSATWRSDHLVKWFGNREEPWVGLEICQMPESQLFQIITKEHTKCWKPPHGLDPWRTPSKLKTTSQIPMVSS